MAPVSVSYVQKLVGIKAVEMRGQIEFRERTPGDRDSGSAYFVGADCMDDWLEKFDGKFVILRIDTYEQDDSHLLPEDERELPLT